MAPINVFEYAASFEDILAGHCCSHQLLSSLVRPGIDCHSFLNLMNSSRDKKMKVIKEEKFEVKKRTVGHLFKWPGIQFIMSYFLLYNFLLLIRWGEVRIELTLNNFQCGFNKFQLWRWNLFLIKGSNSCTTLGLWMFIHPWVLFAAEVSDVLICRFA